MTVFCYFVSAFVIFIFYLVDSGIDPAEEIPCLSQSQTGDVETDEKEMEETIIASSPTDSVDQSIPELHDVEIQLPSIPILVQERSAASASIKSFVS